MEAVRLRIGSRQFLSRSATRVLTPVAIGAVLAVNLALLLLPPAIAVLILAGVIS